MLAVLLVLPFVSALSEGDVAKWDIEVNGDNVDFGTISGNSILNDDDEAATTVSVEEGQTIDVKVVLETPVADADPTTADGLNDIEVEAKIKGYEYSRNEPMSDSTRLFDMAANTQKTVRLNVDLPRNLEEGEYWLHITIDTKNSGSVERVVRLNVEPTRHGLTIDDVAFSPGNTVKAGRSLLTTVLLENFGDKAEDDVKVTVSIPALGVSATEFVTDEIDSGSDKIEYEEVPEMFLSIPANAEEGDYDVVVKAEYDRFETVEEKYTIHVLADERFQPADEETLVLAVGPENQNIAQGKTGRYAVALTNAGSNSRAYLLSAVAGNGLTVSLSDSLVVLEPGKNKVVYADVAVAADATAGAQTVALTISANNEALETISLGATVVATAQPQAAQNVSLRNGLEIALIVLVVVLVIIGLIVGFSRLRKDGDEEDKSYY